LPSVVVYINTKSVSVYAAALEAINGWERNTDGSQKGYAA
jgi:hypothetical protein